MAVHPVTNPMPGLVPQPATNATAGAQGVEFTKRAHYDFAVQGGAVGTIGLLGALGIPLGAIVLNVTLDVTTPLTSGGAATAALQIESAGDVVAATVVSGAPWSTAGRKATLPVGTGAGSIKTTAARDISLVIAVAALTAGVFDAYVQYVVPV